jgi:hypothetical protein
MENPVQNVEMRVDGNKLVITVDLTKPGELSSTGKTMLIASTRGAVPVDHPKIRGIKAALNVMVPAVPARGRLARVA